MAKIVKFEDFKKENNDIKVYKILEYESGKSEKVPFSVNKLYFDTHESNGKLFILIDYPGDSDDKIVIESEDFSKKFISTNDEFSPNEYECIGFNNIQEVKSYLEHLGIKSV